MSADAKHKEVPLHVAASKGDIEAPYLEAARSIAPDYFRTVRAEHLAAFEAAGFPHRRVEEWKYTDLRPKMRTSYALPSDAAPTVTGEGGPFGDLDAYRIVIVNGRLLSKPSDQKGIDIVDLLDGEGIWAGDFLFRQQNAKPKANWVQGLAQHSNFEQKGSFTSSHYKLNQLQSNIKQ